MLKINGGLTSREIDDSIKRLKALKRKLPKNRDVKELRRNVLHDASKRKRRQLIYKSKKQGITDIKIPKIKREIRKYNTKKRLKKNQKKSKILESKILKESPTVSQIFKTLNKSEVIKEEPIISEIIKEEPKEEIPNMEEVQEKIEEIQSIIDILNSEYLDVFDAFFEFPEYFKEERRDFDVKHKQMGEHISDYAQNMTTKRSPAEYDFFRRNINTQIQNDLDSIALRLNQAREKMKEREQQGEQQEEQQGEQQEEQQGEGGLSIYRSSLSAGRACAGRAVAGRNRVFTVQVSSKKRKAPAFAQYVKKHMHELKGQNLTVKERMKKLGEMWRKQKGTQKKTRKTKNK